MGPPKNVEPADLWLEFTAQPRPHRLVDLPRKRPDGTPVGQVAIWTLTQQESFAATVASERFVRKLLKDEGCGVPGANERSDGYTTIYENRAAVEILFRVCRRPDDVSKSFFPTIESISKELTTDEIGVLFAAYNIVRSEIGPIVSRMSQEEFDAWVEVLGKGGAAHPLARLSLAGHAELTRRLAEECLSSRTANSSSGTAPEGSTSEL